MIRLKGLYAVTPDWNDSKRLLASTEAILAGGCRIVQYRNKAASDCHRQEQAGALRALTRRYHALLIVNDFVDLALQIEADGVHLGGDDGDLAAARARLGAGKILGASCYDDLGLARRAQTAGADYVAFGSFFPSQVKPDARRASLDLLRAARAEIELPICAIGGITASNGRALVEAGADLLAVISALYEADDPKAAAEEFASLFGREKT
ncbi:MAG: thiamine phosphate synthase [Hydrogenophilaceae bacterium]|nr:thiamine phosphate synthase [Hydrogenophilaceae bacterium]